MHRGIKLTYQEKQKKKIRRKMKKFYSFLFAAVALVGFAACNSDSTEDQPAPAPQVGKMEFTANIGEDTKTALDGLNVTWCEGDIIGIWDGTATKPFTATEINGNSAKFEGMAALGQAKYYAVYPYVEGATCADGVWTGVNFNNNQKAVVDTFACGANISFAEAEGTHLTFTNSLAVLKFQVPVECQLVEFFGESGLIVKAWAEAEDMMQPENDYYVTVPAGDYKLTARVDAYLSVASTKTLKVAANKIYNLGKLPEQKTTTVYLVPGVWASDNADFAVYFWNGDSTKDLLMTKDNMKNGVYMAEVSEDAQGLIFKRLNPSDHSVWNQTDTLEIQVDGKDHFYITSWDSPYGEWREYVQIEWALSGTFNGWAEQAMTNNNGIWSAEGVSLTAYKDLFKVKAKDDWSNNYGAGFSYMNPGCYASVAFGGGDIAVTETGTYDIYFDEVNTLVYVVTTGSDYKTAIEQTANGPAPVTGNIYYFKPNSNWTQSNAKFSGYFWNGSGNKWAELTDTDKDGIYECNLGEWVPTSVIFLRKDPNGFVYNNWTCWNRIGNITVPSGKNFYTMASGVWSQQIESGNGYTGGTWGTK